MKTTNRLIANLFWKRAIFVFLMIALFLVMSGCASKNIDGNRNLDEASNTSSGIPSLDDDDIYLDSYEGSAVIADPLEPWNRIWYHFNDFTVEYVGRPLYKGYAYITPAGFRKGVKNFFHNLRAPVRMFNCLLQGKGLEAGVEFSSFMVNTTAGIGGIFDIASKMDRVVVPTNEDGGQTLGKWGFGEGLYIVWPLLGPSNVRDTTGMVMDYFMDPTTYIIDSWEISLGMRAYSVLNSFDEVLDAYDTVKGMAVEPYSAVRDGYTQYRRAQVAK